MRVIKFRVWDCELKEMIYDAQDESGYESDGFTDFLHQESRYKVMQFTGLLDKSGKEIWEGDIVLTFDPAHSKQMQMKIIYDISPYCGFFKESADGLRKVMLTNDGYCNTEVLGNIYENPELLNPIPTNKREGE